MALVTQVFDHDSPSAPTLAGGMLLDSAGVKMRALQALGVVTAVSSSDGSFSDINGYGQFDVDSAGSLYVADSDNNRVQKFTKDANGLWTFSEKVANPLGGGTTLSLLAIDRTVSPNQIHLASFDRIVDNTWVKVWSLSGGLAGINSGNSLRSYGSNSASNTAGKATTGLSLAIDGTYAIVTSLGTGQRLLRWNHLTGALQNEETQAAVYSKFVTDGAGAWWAVGANGAAEDGLYKIDTSTFAADGARFDTEQSAQTSRRKQISAGLHYGVARRSNGDLYVRDVYGQVQAWQSDRTYLDEFLWAGGMATASPHFGHGSGLQNGIGASPVRGKHGFVVGPNSVEEYLQWASNAEGTNNESFLLCWQVTTATATWSMTGFSQGPNILKRLGIQGVNLSSEKCKVRLRKNSGAWVTLTMDEMLDEATLLTVGTFGEDDTLTVELNLGGWDRQDGHATRYSCTDKLNPTNVSLALLYEDPEASVFIPSGSGASAGKLAEIVQCLYDVIEEITPHYEASRTLTRWTQEAPLEEADPSKSFRCFRILVPRVAKGALNDSRDKKSKFALVQIAVNYPIRYNIDGDTDYLGVEVMREDDGQQIVNAFCFRRPLPLQSLGDVRSIKWAGSQLVGRLWVISLEIEYMESVV